MNREQWLEAAVNEMRPMFKGAGFKLPPKVFVSVGWPSSGGTRRQNMTIGQAWSPENSADGKTGHVFISPVLADSNRVLDVLVHELGHVVVGVKHGHKAPFVRFCKAIGLDGKPTATVASDALNEKLTALVEKIGVYPHASLAPGERKVQGTRLLKVVCPDCGYTIRVTQKWIDEGYPTCPCGAVMCDPDLLDDVDVLKTNETSIEYTAHNGRFAVRYHKKQDRGRTIQKWYVIDFEAEAIKASVIGTQAEFIIDPGTPRTTALPTRDDVLGFMSAVIEGIYKYPDADAPIDELDDADGWDDDDYLDADEIEDPDFPEDAEIDGEDAYPDNPDDEPVEIVPNTR